MPKPAFYAVRGGPTPGVYLSWAEAVAHGAQGVPGVQQKKFGSRSEAEAYVGGVAAPMPSSQRSSGPSTSVVPAQVPSAQRSSGSSSSVSRPVATIDRPMATKGGVRADELACFTDGACKGNNAVATKVCPAGWGVAIVEGVLGDGASGAGSLLAELYGPVGLDTCDRFFLGAEVGSNNTGELSAICEALLWLVEHDATGRAAVICYDSEYAAAQTQGLQKTNKNRALVLKAQSLLAAARARPRVVRFLHVKGHSGHHWNDVADQLANRGAAGQLCATGRWAVPGAPASARQQPSRAAAGCSVPTAAAPPPAHAPAFDSLPACTPGAALLPDIPTCQHSGKRARDPSSAGCPICGAESSQSRVCGACVAAMG